MLGIVYATMGVISALLVFQNKPINVNKKIVQNIDSVTPLEVLKNKWFFQVVSLPVTHLKCLLKFYSDLDRILQYFHVCSNCCHYIQKFWTNIYQWWPFLLTHCNIPKYSEWPHKNYLGMFIWQVNTYNIEQYILTTHLYVLDLNSRNVLLPLPWWPQHWCQHYHYCSI